MTAPTIIPRLEIAASIDRALGEGRLAAMLHAGMDYKCVACHQTGHLGTGPWVRAWLFIFPTTGKYLVKFVHARCGPGGVDIAEGEVSGPGFDMPDESKSFAMAFAVRQQSPLGLPGPMVPAIVVEILANMNLVQAGPGGAGLNPDRTRDIDGQAIGVAALGMVPVTTVRAMPPVDDRWRVLLPGPAAGDGAILAGRPDGRDPVTIFEPLSEVSFPPFWNEMAAKAGSRCAVFVALRAGLTAHVNSRRADFDEWLCEVGRDNRLMGVSAQVVIHRDDLDWDATERMARDEANWDAMNPRG